jgi:SHS2 domain-containing protein
MKKFEFLDHPADIKIKVYGKSLKELFENAAYAMFKYISHNMRIKQIQKKVVQVKGETYEDILIEWLKELLYIFYTQHIEFNKFNVKFINSNELIGYAYGQKYKSNSLIREIKAVTYHDVKINKNDSFSVELLFDV